MKHLEEAYGTNMPLLLIESYLVLLQKFLNLRDEAVLQSETIEELSLMILSDFKQLKLPEVDLVFKNIKRGKYGTIYGRIDPIFIQGAFRKYFDEDRLAIMRSMPTEDESFKVEFKEEWYEWAKRRLSREFKEEDLKSHLLLWKGFICDHCKESEEKGCKASAISLASKETVNTYAIATYLLAWDKTPEYKDLTQITLESKR